MNYKPSKKEIVSNKITTYDINKVYQSEQIDWEVFRNKTFYITGATGVIGSFLISCLNSADKKSDLKIKIVAAVRDVKKAKIFFKKSSSNYKLVKSDVTEPIKYRGRVDYIIHCASNTSSKSFVEQPKETYDVAVNGTKNILDFAKKKKVKSIIYLSSMEVYGDINEPKPLKETDLGDLDNSPRSSYPKGKRDAETLCYNYAKEYDVPVKVLRLAQIIGANVDYDDSRVYAQFARSIVEKQDIVLNTPAESIRSNCYITDAIIAILVALVNGKNGECYNVASDTPSSIKDIAQNLSQKYYSTNLLFNLQDGTIYPPQSHWILDNEKLKSLGWSATVNIDEMYNKLISSFYFQKDKLEKEKEFQITGIKEQKKSTKDSFLEQIFSIKNKESFKVIKIFGFSIKISAKFFLKKYYKSPIQENKIVFSNFNGNGYGCNPKYIAEEIIKRGLKCDLVWLIKDKSVKKSIPSQFRTVNRSSIQALKELITAKIWIDNQMKVFHINLGLHKRNGQYYIQTWHGALGIKKLPDYHENNINNKFMSTLRSQDDSMTDIILSNSTFEDNIYSFWINTDIKTFGHPRDDIFFKENIDINNKVRQFYNIENDKKIVLYVPTYREDRDLSWYNINYQIVLDALKERFSDDWVFIVKQHPRIANMKINIVPKNENDIIDATYYPDIQELLVTADVVMTDYSSCIFDFMLTRKPAFIYANDIEKYNNERGFFYPLESTPFPIATNNIELVENIKNFDYDKYKIEVEQFLKDKGCIEDGHASERVVDLIEQILNK